MSTNQSLWRRDDGALPNTLALSYAFVAQAIGIALLASTAPALWIIGTVLTGHGLVIAAYLIHDFAHLTVFRRKEHNKRGGAIMSWLCGSAYAPFDRIRKMHVRHHAERTDITLFDAREFVNEGPAWLRTIVYAAEWCYLPAIELIMHYHVVVRPFFNAEYKNERARVVWMALSRIGFFIGLWWLGPQVLIGYAVAYLIMITALFWGDAWAHTYDHHVLEQFDQAIPKSDRDADWDREHTYSNLISERWPWLNLLNLNFGYHNAHHDRPTTPWYKLPEQHYANYPSSPKQVLPYRDLWRTFRINRTRKLSAPDLGEVLDRGHGRADGFMAAHSVSFLSIV